MQCVVTVMVVWCDSDSDGCMVCCDSDSCVVLTGCWLCGAL